MRASPARLVLVGLLPLAACTSQTVRTALPPRIALAEVLAIPPGPERDAAWVKLAPQAPVAPDLARTTIDYPTREHPGTVVVSTQERRLYLVLPGGKAMRYPVSVGKAGMAWSGVAQVDRKPEWPDWNPPPEMPARRPELPNRLEGGPYSPMGARALYLAQGKRDRSRGDGSLTRPSR